MSYRVERLRQANDDLDSLFDFLVESYQHFGDDLKTAVDRAADRVERIKEDMRRLGAKPHQGTRRDKVLTGLRSVTKDRAIFYFTVDDEAGIVRLLAIFFGGQDHQRAMLRRLRRKK